MCDQHSIKPVFNGLNHLNYGYFDELDRSLGAHHPLMLKIGCWDARMDGRLHNLPPGKVLFHRSAGATLPQNVLWDPNLQGYLSLADFKDIQQIVVAPHSDCLAANTALKFPHRDHIPQDHPHYYNMQVIHNGLGAVGANLPEYSDRCWTEAHGNETEATNLMAKRLAIVSLSNLMNYHVRKNGEKTISQAIIDKEIDVAVIFINIQEGHFEYLSLDTQEFHPLAPKTAPSHMCVRENDCNGCHCGEQVTDIAQTITFYPQLQRV